MNCEIQNLTRQLVSVHCNSGKTYHLPPGYTHELPEQEINGNAFVKKLSDRKLIAVRQLSKSSTSSSQGETASRLEKTAVEEKPPRKKAHAKK